MIDDSRIYKIIQTNKNLSSKKILHPLRNKMTFVGEFWETPESLLQSHLDLKDTLDTIKKDGKDTGILTDESKKSYAEHWKFVQERIKWINSKTGDMNLAQQYSGGFSAIHPYALLNLYGASSIKQSDQLLALLKQANKEYNDKKQVRESLSETQKIFEKQNPGTTISGQPLESKTQNSNDAIAKNEDNDPEVAELKKAYYNTYYDSSYGMNTDALANFMEDTPSNVYDKRDIRKWYEINVKDSNYSGRYAKNPTTSDLINWAAQEPRGRFPYSYTDFVYCKYWNKIPNNHLITLRRFANPTTDNLEPANYDGGNYENTGKTYESITQRLNPNYKKDSSTDASGAEGAQTAPGGTQGTTNANAANSKKTNAKNSKATANNSNQAKQDSSVNTTDEYLTDKETRPIYAIKSAPMRSSEPYTPLCTAVTYFGGDTGNKLNDILKFTVGYNWTDAKSDVWEATSNQQEDGGMVNSNTWTGAGIGFLSRALGILGDLKGDQPIDSAAAAGLPPDPYAPGGVYENRIIGPINVITSVKKRDRGLKFTQDGLSITFEYVSRPIAGINNKAILLDLLGNMLAMTYSEGHFFGGAVRYRNANPAIYPWRNTSDWNKLYSGKLFGKNGFYSSVVGRVFNKENFNFLGGMIKGLLEGVMQGAKDFLNTCFGNGKDNSQEAAEKRKKAGSILTRVKGTAGRALAAKLVKGTTAPWLQNAHALLTGEPVGDWHLTIGNPLNPIAMIGNLIVDTADFEFSDELGPDDFPIGFKCVVHLKHGMARDRGAAESMFNRGNGRIYMLPNGFRSSADSETTVDAYTGVHNKQAGTFNISPRTGTLAPSGADYIRDSKVVDLADSNAIIYDHNEQKLNNYYNPMQFTMLLNSANDGIANYYYLNSKFVHFVI